MNSLKEINEAVQGTIDRWAPKNWSDEKREIQMVRALLNLHAFELDYQRVLNGETPIRTDYPLLLPRP